MTTIQTNSGLLDCLHNGLVVLIKVLSTINTLCNKYAHTHTHYIFYIYIGHKIMHDDTEKDMMYASVSDRDSLGEEAVTQSGRTGSDAPEPFSRRLVGEEALGGVGGVTNDAGGFLGTLCPVNVQYGGE